MSFDKAIAGQEPGPLVIGPFTRTDIVRYQGASGDMNPVHHDEVFAKKSGFPAPLGVGMFTAGCMTTWATDWLGPEHVQRTRIRFKKPVFPGVTVSFAGKVIARDESARTVEVEVWGTDDAGDAVVQGWITFDFGAGA